MAIHSARGATSRGGQATLQSTKLAAPNKGMDGRVGLGSDDLEVCIYTYNLLPGEFGMKVRNGYREYVLNLDNGASSGVKTIIPYEGLTSDPADDRLFAITNEGIWNATTDGDETPVLEIAFSNQAAPAGIGTYTHYVDDAGAEFLFYADGLNGLFRYTKSTDTWIAITTEITGVDPTLVRFIVVHKQRIWLVEQDSADGWYLPIGSALGLAVVFHFGAQFKHGGKLAGLYNWSVDGGEGIDDFLVAISNAGDVLPYKGDDPEGTADNVWAIHGVYFVGSVAGSQRCASEFGGDLHILSNYGLTNMSDLLKGVDPVNYRGNSLGSRMSLTLRQDMDDYRISDGWSVNFLPSEGVMLIATPKRDNGTFIQYAYDLSVDAFGYWRDVPMLSNAAWRSTIYVGTEDNRILAMDSSLDNVQITPPADDQNGQDIQFSTLFSYSSFGTPAQFKRGSMIRPDFISNDAVSYEAKFNYEYNLEGFPNELVRTDFTQGFWDLGNWDQAVWGGQTLDNINSVNGTWGYGRSMAVALHGAAKSRTWLISVDVMWNNAGIF